MEGKNPHAILIPLPHQGHVNPFINLAIDLASKGFTITFVNTQFTHQEITQSDPSAGAGDRDIFAGARESGLDIRYTTISDGFPLGFDRVDNENQFLEGMIHVFSAHVDDVVGKICMSAEDPPLTCLIADTFYVWPSFIADKYNLVHVSFWTGPALVFTIYYHLQLLKWNGHFASHDDHKYPIGYIPGVQSIDPKDLMSHLHDMDIQQPIHRIIYKSFDDVKLSDFIICNTVQELELEPITALNREQPFYAIGPMLSTGLTKPVEPTNLQSESNCTKWLDSKPPGSIIYVALDGSIQLTKSSFLDIAYGLLACDAGFIWVVRPDTVGYGEDSTLPVRLEEGLKTKGLIVPWCSQVDVLAHQAIGGFLTHCGWNSVLESARCGVPMLCWPLYDDEFTNRKLVVDDWKAGINLIDERWITKEEVGDKINRLMCGKSTNEARQNAVKLRGTIEHALGPDGSSRKNMNGFVKAVKGKIQEKVVNLDGQ